jgi:hypothetical protein
MLMLILTLDCSPNACERVGLPDDSSHARPHGHSGLPAAAGSQLPNHYHRIGRFLLYPCPLLLDFLMIMIVVCLTCIQNFGASATGLTVFVDNNPCTCTLPSAFEQADLHGL